MCSILPKAWICIIDSGDIYTGYDLQFFYEANNLLGYDQITLRDDVLTIPFGGDTLKIKRARLQQDSSFGSGRFGRNSE
jgi:hypothetical protein